MLLIRHQEHLLHDAGLTKDDLINRLAHTLTLNQAWIAWSSVEVSDRVSTPCEYVRLGKLPGILTKEFMRGL
jgi:hypothetical protein